MRKAFHREDGQEQPELVSTSQGINLTCTLASLSSLFALFLYFNDERSRAVRRCSIQSIALGVLYIGCSAMFLLIGSFFSIIPVLGMVVTLVLWVAFIALTLVVCFLKYQMMKRAYRGYAYQLPAIGGWLRRFE